MFFSFVLSCTSIHIFFNGLLLFCFKFLWCFVIYIKSPVTNTSLKIECYCLLPSSSYPTRMGEKSILSFFSYFRLLFFELVSCSVVHVKPLSTNTSPIIVNIIFYLLLLPIFLIAWFLLAFVIIVG